MKERESPSSENLTSFDTSNHFDVNGLLVYTTDLLVKEVVTSAFSSVKCTLP